MVYGQELVDLLEGQMDNYRRAIARRMAQISEGDFDESDSFVSQRVDERGMSVTRSKIHLLKECQGYGWFTEYQTLDGVLVDATWCNTRYGEKLRVEFPDGTVKWTTATTKKGLAKIGLRKVVCKRSAWFCFRSSGSGMMGVYTGSYVMFPSDTNYWTGKPAEGEPIEIMEAD